MTKVFTNKDAQFIHDFAMAHEHTVEDGVFSRLLAIASHIQGLDDKSIASYSKGFTDGRNSVYARSNVAKAEPTDFTSLEEAIANFKGEVKKINPVVKKSMQETLTVDDLDLDL
jgi:hypothetical protein